MSRLISTGAKDAGQTGIHDAGQGLASAIGADSIDGSLISWPLLADDGTATAPSYSFSNDSDAGIYKTANGVAMAVGGGQQQEWLNGANIFATTARPNATGSVNLGTAGKTWGTGYIDTLLAGDGTVGAPAYSFASDTDTGWYLNSVGQLKVATAGTARIQIASNVKFIANIYAANDTYDVGIDGNRWKRIIASGVVHEYGTHNGDYTVLPTDRYIRENSAGAFTHTLPSAPPNGTTYTFWANGDGALTVAAGSGDTIAGGSTITVALSTAMTLVYDSAAARWHYITHGTAS